MRMSGLSAAVFGRVDEVERLRDLVRGAMSGRGAAVLVEGEPGIGKTTLLNAVAAESERLGARVLRGAATEPECRLPFAAIGSCLAASVRAGDPQSARVAALLTGEGRTLAAAGAADREFVVAEAILDLVDRWCTEGPVTLLMDDLQWADASSLLVLNRLGRAISQAPLLVAAACRRMPRAEELDGLLRSLDARGAVSLTLGRAAAGSRRWRRRQPAVRHRTGRRAVPGRADPGRRRGGDRARRAGWRRDRQRAPGTAGVARRCDRAAPGVPVRSGPGGTAGGRRARAGAEHHGAVDGARYPRHRALGSGHRGGTRRPAHRVRRRAGLPARADPPGAGRSTAARGARRAPDPGGAGARRRRRARRAGGAVSTRRWRPRRGRGGLAGAGR